MLVSDGSDTALAHPGLPRRKAGQAESGLARLARRSDEARNAGRRYHCRTVVAKEHDRSALVGRRAIRSVASGSGVPDHCVSQDQTHRERAHGRGQHDPYAALDVRGARQHAAAQSVCCRLLERDPQHSCHRCHRVTRVRTGSPSGVAHHRSQC